MHARIAIGSSHTRSRCRASTNGRRRDDDRPAVFMVHSDGLPSHDLPVYHCGLQIPRFLETDGRATCDHPPPFAGQALSQIPSRMRHQYTTAVFRTFSVKPAHHVSEQRVPFSGAAMGRPLQTRMRWPRALGVRCPKLAHSIFEHHVIARSITMTSHPFHPKLSDQLCRLLERDTCSNFFLSAHMSPERLADQNLLRQRARPTS